jgi:cytosine permease
VHWRHLAVYAFAAFLAWLSGELEFGIPPLIGIVVAIALMVVLHRRAAASADGSPAA